MYRSKFQIHSEGQSISVCAGWLWCTLLTAQEEQLPDTLVTFFDGPSSFDQEIRSSEPPRKRRRVTKERGTNASRIDDAEDYLTLALVTIDLVRPGFWKSIANWQDSLQHFTYSLSAPLSGVRPPQDDEKELSVLLRQSQGDHDGAFSLHASSPAGRTVVDFNIPSTIPLQTLDVLVRLVI